mgnify:CR=1 FL=1
MNETIKFRISKEDKKYLQKEADKFRMPIGTYVRMIVWSRMPKNQKPI